MPKIIVHSKEGVSEYEDARAKHGMWGSETVLNVLRLKDDKPIAMYPWEQVLGVRVIRDD